ncbi:MAG: ArgK protein, partial [Candidatus Cloacimonetes bacterium]|nr:ArgK protein [Candidatus Cloacimonadota bacterium]
MVTNHNKIEKYKPKNHIRMVTASSLFDGHDATINIIRRIIQSTGAEVIHLGHNRSVQEIVDCAVCEDVQAIAITSYQGGHVEFFKHMLDLLRKRNCAHIKVFGGGGGVILPDEIKELHEYGVSRIYSPDDGRVMGLQGMINNMLESVDVPTGKNNKATIKGLQSTEDKVNNVARLISAAENYPEEVKDFLTEVSSVAKDQSTPVIGITGTGGSGKSSLVDELVRRFLADSEDKTIAIISVDPSKRKTGGALLGDRIRMNSINNSRVYMRSLATRQSNLALSKYVSDAVNI